MTNLLKGKKYYRKLQLKRYKIRNILISTNPPKSRAVGVAQLVERSLPIPELRGSNPVIGKNYIGH